MNQIILYFITIFLSNTIGALSGMGGGVIIKPVLDFLGFHTLSAIAFYSSVAVFTMSFSSTYKQLKSGITINLKNAVSVSAGSLLGGTLGDYSLNQFLKELGSENQVQVIQNVIMIVTLFIVLFYNHWGKKKFYCSAMWSYFLAGTFLGLISTFLGIGGGPINVAALMFFFGMDIKSATVYSIITIFFSQIAKLTSIQLTSGFQIYDLSILWAVIPAALLGGYTGGLISGKLTEDQIKKVYGGIVFFVLLINAYNLFSAITSR